MKSITIIPDNVIPYGDNGAVLHRFSFRDDQDEQEVVKYLVKRQINFKFETAQLFTSEAFDLVVDTVRQMVRKI